MDNLPITPAVYSDPPAVRLINARAAAAVMIMASVIELAAIGALAYALSINKISGEVFVGAILGALVGPGIGKARGKLGTTSLGLALGLLGPKSATTLAGAAGVAKHLSLTLLALVTALAASSCAGAPVRPDKEEIAKARQDLGRIGPAADAAFVAASWACTAAPRLDDAGQRLCGMLVPAQSAYRRTLKAAWSAVDLYEAGIMTREGLLDAIDAAGDFVRLWQDTEKVVTDAAAALGVPGLDGGSGDVAPSDAGAPAVGAEPAAGQPATPLGGAP